LYIFLTDNKIVIYDDVLIKEEIMKKYISRIKKPALNVFIITFLAIVIALPTSVAAISFSGNSPQVVYPQAISGAAGQVAFFTSGTDIASDPNLYWNNTSKRLGIGTSAPSRPLHVKGDVALFERNANSAGFIIDRTGAASPNRWVFGVDEPTGFVIKTLPGGGNPPVEQLVITKDDPTTPWNESRVGIGTTSPEYKLEVREQNGKRAIRGFSEGYWGIGVTGCSDAGYGVYGVSNGDGIGVCGVCNGNSLDNIGVHGESINGNGVHGESTNGNGVLGDSTGNDAVKGTSHSNNHSGVMGFNDSSGYGVWGSSTNGKGVYGKNDANGNYGTLGTGTEGVYGYSNTGYAGNFDGMVKINGALSTAFRSLTGPIEYTLTTSDSIIAANAQSGDVTVHLPTAAGCTGRQYTIKRTDGSSSWWVRVLPDGSEKIDEASSYYFYAQWKYVTLVSDGSNWLIIGNN
jgi:hypothetical protein